MKGLNHIQNENKECFSWCFLKYLNPVNKNLAKIWNIEEAFAKQLDFKSVKFTANKKDYA